MRALSPTINVMVMAARKAARGLARDFGEVEQLQVSLKGTADFVTAADIRAEKTLVSELSHARPEFGILTEETGVAREGDGEQRFIIDPLDGTLNFMHGLPHFAISIAHERKGEIVGAVILEPVNGNLYRAERGQGAYFNDRRMRVSARSELKNAVFATGIPWMGRPGHEAFLDEIEAIMPLVAGIRRFGSAALDLAYVAAGRYEGFWEAGLKPWDIAAGILMVREAGGYATDLDGGTRMLETGGIVAANSALHGGLLRTLKNARKAGARRIANARN